MKWMQTHYVAVQNSNKVNLEFCIWVNWTKFRSLKIQFQFIWKKKIICTLLIGYHWIYIQTPTKPHHKLFIVFRPNERKIFGMSWDLTVACKWPRSSIVCSLCLFGCVMNVFTGESQALVYGLKSRHTNHNYHYGVIIPFTQNTHTSYIHIHFGTDMIIPRQSFPSNQFSHFSPV